MRIAMPMFVVALGCSGSSDEAQHDDTDTDVEDTDTPGDTDNPGDTDDADTDPPDEDDVWTQIVGDGFGAPIQDTVPEMEVFKGQLYIATSPTGMGIANLYRSATGDADSWTQITDFSPPLQGDKSIHSFGVTDLGGGYIWAGTGNGVFGGMVYRSADGLSWTAVFDQGFGNSDLTGTAPHMVVFQGHLYAGMGSHGEGTPGEVWRIPYDSTDPSDAELLMDFNVIDQGVQTITYFYVWKNTLYVGTDAGGQLWESTDGVNFTQNAGVGIGFDDPTNYVLSSLVDYDDHLYATTTNRFGGQLWRTSDGATWEQLTADAFGKGEAVNELRSLRVSFDTLWLTAYTNTDVSLGTPIWKSVDGVNFEQSNEDGFGNVDNSGQNAVTIGFGDHQYFGGPNYVDGGQVWRSQQQ